MALVADGKPRPAVIVQADSLPTPVMVLICPLTSELTDAPLYRVPVQPTADNGLRAPSQLMVDRLYAIRRDRVGKVVGRLGDADLGQLDFALTLMLDLAR